MLRYKVGTGKNFTPRILVKLAGEIKVAIYLLNLSILYLLLYAYINSGKITVLRISCLVIAVKF